MSSYYTYEGNLRDRNKFTSTVNTTFGTKRYFSSLDTEVYFGAEQIDEIVAIDFTIAEPKLPIYGFNSFYANRIVSGRRTIQGTFAINFTSVYYLLNILNKIDDSVLKASYSPAGSETALDYESLLYRCEGEDSTGLGIGNNAIFSKMFDITLSYGYGKTDGMKTYNSCYQTLVGVQIVDYRQALDTEGNPILDMYSFIAKDIKYVDSNNEAPEKPEDPVTTPVEPEKPETPEEPESPQYLVANNKIASERDELKSKCQNSNIPGFLVEPTFNFTPPGQHTGSTDPYLRLTISSLNNNTEIFKSVSISIEDKANGISNMSVSLKDVKKDSSYGSIYEFEGSMRELGEKLVGLYTKNENYKASCTVEFLATINGTSTVISYSTKLILGSTLK